MQNLMLHHFALSFIQSILLLELEEEEKYDCVILMASPLKLIMAKFWCNCFHESDVKKGN